MKLIAQLEELEKGKCNIPLLFAEILKDEVNSAEEHKIYNGIKRFTRKYAEDKKAIDILDELVKVLSGGATLLEILQVTADEADKPSAATEITAGDNCEYLH